jgi:hypothetical protein
MATPPQNATQSDDGWAAAFAAADAGSTVLDDPIALEDRAIYRWMKAHILPRFSHIVPHVKGRQFILGNTILPKHWMDQTIGFATLEEAKAFVRDLRRNTAAMRVVVDLMNRADGSLLVCETVDSSLDRLARMLMNGTLWLMPYEKPQQPDIGSTDPSVYTGINQQNNTRLDPAKLSAWEGGQYQRGYVPFTTTVDAAGASHTIVAGRSGMTIATGFDIGQHSADYLRNVDGLSAGSLALLLPYAGKQFTHLSKTEVIAKIGQLGPVPVVDKNEADALDRAVAIGTLADTMSAWAAGKKPYAPAFTDLPAAWQTVMFSRTYNQGRGWVNPGSATQGLFTAASEGRWRDAATALRDAPGPGWFRSRVQAEAAYLATDMPAAVTPPAATAVPAAAGSKRPLH